jgi:thiopeptide-type bacteriocin biosynthesis protein
MTAARDFAPYGFFLMRSPLLSAAELCDWYRNDEALPLDDESRFSLALELGSPALFEALRNGNASKAARARRAAERYLVRASSRCAPFGLFSGISIGTIGEHTELRLAPRAEYRLRARADGHLLALAARRLRQLAGTRDVTYVRNETLLRVGRWYRFLAIDLTRKEKNVYVTTTVVRDNVLDAVVDLTKEPTPAAALISFIAAIGNVDPASAANYVTSLVERGVLARTGLPPPDAHLALNAATAALADEEPELAKRLDQYAAAVESIGVSVGSIRKADIDCIISQARVLGFNEPRFPANVVMVKPGAFSLSSEVVQDIAEGIDILRSTARSRTHPLLRHFKERFVARYEAARLPLIEALDPDIGISIDELTEPDAERFLRAFKAPPEAEEGAFGRHEELLLDIIAGAQPGAIEVELTGEQLKALSHSEPYPIPESFNVLCTLGQRADGHYDVFIGGAGGPPGVRLMTRFAFASEDLDAFVRDAVATDQKVVAPALLAEIVHQPADPTQWNVSLRPPLRAVELPVLGIPTTTSRQLALQSLFVGVAEDRIIITTADGTEVLPRLTSGHNFLFHRNPVLYKFLGALQSQNSPMPLDWSWGALSSRRFLPRVRCGRIVLSSARWRFTRAELERHGEIDAIAAFLMESGIPPLVLVDGLLLDLRAPRALPLLHAGIKRSEQLLITECFPGPETMVAEGPEGRFVCEIDLPFHRIASEKRAVFSPVDPQPASTFHPGDEWLFAKLYCAPRMSDDLLTAAVRPLTQRLRTEGMIDRWFFIRYADPDFHLRLRLRHREGQHGAVMTLLRDVLREQQLERFVHRITFDTYEREIDRYGGATGIVLAESLFHADSEAILESIAAGVLDTFADKLAYATLAIEQLLARSGLEPDEQSQLLANWVDRMKGRLPHPVNNLRQVLAEAYRSNGAHIQRSSGIGERVTARGVLVGKPLNEIVAAERAGMLTKQLRELMFSLCHMTINRIFTKPVAAQELLAYDAARKRLVSARARTHACS